MEEGKGERYLASGRQYGNALLGVCHQEEGQILGERAKIQTDYDWFHYFNSFIRFITMSYTKSEKREVQ